MNTQSIYSEYTPAGAERRKSVLGWAAASVQSMVQRAARSMMLAHLERRTIDELSSLPNHILQDIGLSRGNIRGVAADLAKERATAWARQARGSNGFGG